MRDTVTQTHSSARHTVISAPGHTLGAYTEVSTQAPPGRSVHTHTHRKVCTCTLIQQIFVEALFVPRSALYTGAIAGTKLMLNREK